MNRTLSFTSFVLSIAALAVAIYGQFSPAPAKPDPELIRKSVDAELQRRETELVTAWAPKFRTIYKDMLDERAINPKILTDLFRPMISIIEKMQGSEVGIPPQK